MAIFIMRFGGVFFLVLLCSLVLNTYAAQRNDNRPMDVDVGIKGEEIVFDSAEQLNEHIRQLNQKAKGNSKSTSISNEKHVKDRLAYEDEKLSEREEMELKKDELRARLKLEDVKDTFGKVSHEYATALHKLGGVLHKLHNFEEGFKIAQEIVRIHEKIDGVEHIKTAQALSNVGAVAYRLDNRQECDWAMNRALYIYIKKYGDDSKEVINDTHIVCYPMF